MKLIFILSSILLLSFTSCKKKVTEINPDFIGTWEEEGKGEEGGRFISIDENSYAYYQRTSSLMAAYNPGYARIKKDVLIIRMKRFKIDQYPKEDNSIPGISGSRTMILDGITYRD